MKQSDRCRGVMSCFPCASSASVDPGVTGSPVHAGPPTALQRRGPEPGTWGCIYLPSPEQCNCYSELMTSFGDTRLLIIRLFPARQFLEVPDGHRAPVPTQSCSSGSQSDPTSVTTPLSSVSLSPSPCSSPYSVCNSPPKPDTAHAPLPQG